MERNRNPRSIPRNTSNRRNSFGSNGANANANANANNARSSSSRGRFNNRNQGRNRNITNQHQEQSNETGSIHRSVHNNRGVQRRHGNGFHIGFKYIESLLEKPLDEILSKLSENKDFLQLLQKDLSSDLIVLIVKLIEKFCDCDFSTIRLQMLQKSLTSNFLNTIQLYISKLAFQRDDEKRKNSYFWKDPDSFWNSFSKICKTVLKEMPQRYSEPLSKTLKMICVNIPVIEINHNLHISDGIKENYKHLVEMSENVLIELEKKEKKALQIDKDEGEPPDDFREISVYPTTMELLGQGKPFLRKNVIKGPYRDVDHYLDVQFRLLREDFVGPLREGINAHITNVKTKNFNIRVHKRVQFLNPVAETEHFCALLRFNFNNRKKNSFKYENSRRFMFGSLVCFTRDNFQNLIFGKIVKREAKNLANGEIIIGFDSNETLIYNVDYVMIECSVYFEPYYHVLTVMQHMTEDQFPLQNFIIDVDTSNQFPNYISVDTKFDVIDSVSTKNFWLTMDQHDKYFNFNDSQNTAFIAALTRKFSVIQGPPGTGKTFVGLKIAKTLLDNKQYWHSRSPMLVICYTNHALDQFLEGILNYTQEIVRIGGQSKNENLDQFNLRQCNRKMSHSLYQSKAKVKQLLSEIKTITENLRNIRSYNSILNFNDFRSVIMNFQGSWLDGATNEDLLNWLIGNDEFENTHVADGEITDFPQPDEYETDDEYREDEYENVMKDDFDDLLSELTIPSFKSLLDIYQLEHTIRKSEIELTILEKQMEEGNYEEIFKYSNLEMEIAQCKTVYELCHKKLEEARHGIFEEPEVQDARKSKNISIDQRWNLYFHWVELYKIHLLNRYENSNNRFRLHYKIYNEAKDLENIQILKDKHVIGMTTTSAARLHSSLQMLKSPIVIVEEAAEVLEAHIVTSLTKHCQQLILIGDHQQLKPSTSNYQIETFYNLGISLFERMILNNVECFTLSTQHRMRPEISSLIKPHIYPNLQDHESVLNRPQIKGVTKCVYFIDHQFPEKEDDDTGTTKKNMHEVTFLIQLAKYLVLNGYKTSEITILAAYLGQMFELQKERSKFVQLREMKITVLDNYQGEECDIILLSLVRNNPERRVGFISIENRICVALSRARNGLYIMGNMSHLCERSDIWCKVKETLESQDALGKSLTLKCQIHEKLTEATVANDFMTVIEGGCDRICGALLCCNHNCKSLCHILDREHLNYKCQEECKKPLCDTNPSHICLKRCYDVCGLCHYPVTKILKCEHEAIIPCYSDENTYKCLIEIKVTLLCGHETEKPCYVELEKHKCPFKCDTRLECGHACLKTCHALNDPDHLKYECPKPCSKPPLECQNPDLPDHVCPKLCFQDCIKCNIKMRKERHCGHMYDVPCSTNIDDIECHKPCRIVLPCGHKCKSGCDSPCGRCEQTVKKNVPDCNHTVKVSCYIDSNNLKEYCIGKCPRIMTCGHVCKKRCKEKCDSSNCKEMVDTTIPSKCGHVIKKLPCAIKRLYDVSGETSIENLEKYCTEPCTEFLNCSPDNKHICTGTCGTCFQGRIHKRCADKCGRILVCNHECEVSCQETCKPCQKPCSYKCKHSACKKRCGAPCTKCNERCNRRCIHQQCRNICGKICTVPPCEMPCEKRIEKCGHRCIGFCGDPCPTLCRICDKEELEEFFFGTEDEEDARFVLLNDCGHTLESSGMELWLTQDENEIKFKVCPKCKTTIYTTERYSDYIKRAVEDIEKVKNKQSGTNNDVLIKRNEIKTRLEEILGTIAVTSSQSRFFNIISANINVIYSRLFETNKKGRKQQINLVELNSIEIKSKLIENINEILKKHGNIPNISNLVDKQINFILKSLLREVDDITTTEIDDIQREITRLERILLFEKLKNTPQGLTKATNPEVQNLYEKISKHLFSLFKYKKEIDETVEVYLKDLDKLLKTFIGVTEIEKAQIVKAIGLAKGHWYKCPNGHPYAIGECGGAMQVSTCIECKAPIGGQSHRLIHNNAVATEMDGATYGAWSEGANMGNYML